MPKGKGSLCSSLCSEILLLKGGGKEYQKRGSYKNGEMSNFCKGKNYLKAKIPLDFHKESKFL